MFCRMCGKQLPEDAVFCSGCGTKVLNVTDEINSIMVITAEDTSTSDDICPIDENDYNLEYKQLDEKDFYLEYKPLDLKLNLFRESDLGIWFFSNGDHFLTMRGCSSEASRSEVCLLYGKPHLQRTITKDNYEHEETCIYSLDLSDEGFEEAQTIKYSVLCDEYVYEEKDRQGSILFYYDEFDQIVLMAFIVGNREERDSFRNMFNET